MNVYIVVVEDRHCDVEVLLFKDETDALAAARGAANMMARGYPGDIRLGLSKHMVDAGWVWQASVGFEGDCVRVEMQELG